MGKEEKHTTTLRKKIEEYENRMKRAIVAYKKHDPDTPRCHDMYSILDSAFDDSMFRNYEDCTHLAKLRQEVNKLEYKLKEAQKKIYRLEELLNIAILPITVKDPPPRRIRRRKKIG
jgi:hypothetical protein